MHYVIILILCIVAVGPGADKGGKYPNPEYYSYNKLSYFDLEVEMSSDRIKQPSADNGHF